MMRNVNMGVKAVAVEVVPLAGPVQGNEGNSLIGIGHEHGEDDEASFVSVLIDDAAGGARVAVLTVEQAMGVAMLMIEAIACLRGDVLVEPIPATGHMH